MAEPRVPQNGGFVSAFDLYCRDERDRGNVAWDGGPRQRDDSELTTLYDGDAEVPDAPVGRDNRLPNPILRAREFDFGDDDGYQWEHIETAAAGPLSESEGEIVVWNSKQLYRGRIRGDPEQFVDQLRRNW